MKDTRKTARLLSQLVWFQNRRAKWRKKENTKKGPGRPAHNAQLTICSGEPISADEIARRERIKVEKKLKRQREKTVKQGSTSRSHKKGSAEKRLDMHADKYSKLSSGDHGVKKREDGGCRPAAMNINNQRCFYGDFIDNNLWKEMPVFKDHMKFDSLNKSTKYPFLPQMPPFCTLDEADVRCGKSNRDSFSIDNLLSNSTSDLNREQKLMTSLWFNGFSGLYPSVPPSVSLPWNAITALSMAQQQRIMAGHFARILWPTVAAGPIGMIDPGLNRKNMSVEALRRRAEEHKEAILKDSSPIGSPEPRENKSPTTSV
ncbi:putative homeobox protein unc-4-like isoform X2 [Apostichopus japonicus]|uniref:Putative homeobox protein unc-4-like isoform X2 n=1 Tax=Stichopus japonicus TaxID=307972 RepID=A0A2G8L8I0_STIJA|nr:putative homeobox protein unc-4-like isoform X2 [Apostichopus japonicus]